MTLHRPTKLSERADSTDRIAAAESALATLDAAASAMGNAADLVRLSMRREAVASARFDGLHAGLRDVLRLEATRERDGTLPCARAEASALHALRFLAALGRGLQRVGEEGRPTSEVMRDVLARLLEDSQRSVEGWPADARSSAADCPTAHGCGITLPAAVETAIAEVGSLLSCSRTLAETVSAATEAHRRIGSASVTMRECAPLARIVFMLVICASDRPWRALLAPSAAAIRQIRETSSAEPSGPTDRHEPGNMSIAWDAELVVHSVADTLALADRIETLSIEDEDRIASLGKAAHSARRVHAALQRRPVMTLPQILESTGLRVQPATSALHRLRALGIISEISGRHRNRVFGYDGLIALLEHRLW